MLRHPNKGPGPHRPAAPAPPTADGGKSAARAKRKNPSRRAGPQAYPLLAISSLSSCSSSSSSFTLFFFFSALTSFFYPIPCAFPFPFFHFRNKLHIFWITELSAEYKSSPNVGRGAVPSNAGQSWLVNLVYGAVNHTAPQCTTVQHSAPQCNTVHHTEPQCTKLNQSAVHHSAPARVQCSVTARYTILQPQISPLTQCNNTGAALWC